MLESDASPNIERDQQVIEAPIVRETALPAAVPTAVRELAAANEPSVRRTRRRARSIVWDDGGLKPFRVA
jgi:hypothetical protein